MPLFENEKRPPIPKQLSLVQGFTKIILVFLKFQCKLILTYFTYHKIKKGLNQKSQKSHKDMLSKYDIHSKKTCCE